MSNTPKDELRLPIDLPKCACFQFPDPHVVMSRCATTAQSCNAVAQAFNQMAHDDGLCVEALPYFLDLCVVSILTMIAKRQGPALQFGSREIEWEVERLLTGMEARVLARSRDTYDQSRQHGLTEEVVKAMRERGEKGDQS